MLWEFGRIQLLASTSNLCPHVPQLTGKRLRKITELLWFNFFLFQEFSEKSWQFVVSCEIYLVRKGFNWYSLDMCLTSSSACSCVCMVRSGYSTLLLTSDFLLQTEGSLRDCNKFIGLKYHLSVASIQGFSILLIKLPLPLLWFMPGILEFWVIWYSLYLANFVLQIVYYGLTLNLNRSSKW